MATPTPRPATEGSPESTPWWRQPMVLMVIAGPLAVVIASFVTLSLAIRHPDPVLETHAPPQGELDARKASMLPAMQGRNQAANVALKPEMTDDKAVIVPAKP